MKKWELSLLIAILVTLLCCAAAPQTTLQWWTAAFEPLCGGILTRGGGEGVVLRSKLLELAGWAV